MKPHVVDVWPSGSDEGRIREAIASTLQVLALVAFVVAGFIVHPAIGWGTAGVVLLIVSFEIEEDGPGAGREDDT